MFEVCDKKKWLESLVEPWTLEMVKVYNIELLSIFSIKSKSMLYYKEKKLDCYSIDFLFEKWLKGKPISYFKAHDFHFGVARESFLNSKGNVLSVPIKPRKRKNKYLNQINHNFVTASVEQGEKDYAFIRRYSREMFNNHIKTDNRPLTPTQVDEVYAARHTAFAHDEMRTAFIALYGVSMQYFAINDVYTIDGVFDFSAQNRLLDEQKQRAGAEVFAYFQKGGEVLNEFIKTVTDSIFAVKPPPLDIDDPGLIKKNYPIYRGLSFIGQACLSTNIENKKARNYAEKLSDFSLYHSYYNETNRAVKKRLRLKIEKKETNN
ncbi:MAG: hypothetical protein FWH05_06945 [Oscillospiraceae bacterium]|nr:hypothetical protein [Oscillospiraceae bacterium]